MVEAASFLLVEDNTDHVLLFKRAFERAGIINPLQVLKNAHEAICYLEGVGRYKNRTEFPLPAIILLDLKLPGISGFDLLRFIREQPGLKSLRVVVMTSSESIRDVNLAYQLGANSFLVKPVDIETFTQLVRAIQGLLDMDKQSSIGIPRSECC